LLAVDRVFTQVVLAGGSHQALQDQVDTLLPTEGVGDGDERGRLLHGGKSIVLCGSCYERARFDECRQHAASARAHFGEERQYGNIVLDVYLGMAAMAQGRAGEAASCYARAWRGTRANFSSDPCLALCLTAVRIELDLERNREKALDPQTLKDLSQLRAVWTDLNAAAIAVSAELMLEQGDSQAVTRFLVKTREDVRAMRSQGLSRHVSGLLVSHLAESGEVEEAARVWRDEALPEEPAALLDLEGQPWRAMESLACARIRLLAAQGEFAAAEDLASRLCATASEHGLVRAQLRGLALAMAAGEGAGRKDRALERMLEFLRVAREADYVRPLVRCREVSRAVLGRLLESGPDADRRAAAESMLARLDEQKPDTPVFSARELQVLAEVSQGRRNREIAGRLGISEPGVRFHLANIYRKTGVSQRHEAVRNAQSLGVLD
ncbi:MAG: LuxR C-terminal-related transcriptional regulator, partial [Acidobacteria bacterium]|nr:LuxR C-terminal-related transcriptional regulator [Acidobacteriota bacterium]